MQKTIEEINWTIKTARNFQKEERIKLKEIKGTRQNEKEERIRQKIKYYSEVIKELTRKKIKLEQEAK